MKTVVVVASIAVLFLAGLTYAQYQGNAPSARAEDAVRNADAAWAKAVSSKSVEQTLAFYTADAVTGGSAMFPAHGLNDFRTAWAAAFAERGFALTWKAEKVVVTNNGSIAYSSGTWKDGKQHGPYLAVWQKQANAQWKVIIDSAWVMP